MKFYSFLLSLLLSLPAFGQFTSGINPSTLNLKEKFGPYQGCFVLYDLTKHHYSVYNTEGSKARFSPCSSFKIVNSLIALETGLAKDTGYFIAYDSLKYPRTPGMPANWFKDQTMRSAFKNSVVWYYREIAKKIGETEMTLFLNNLNYGNKDISSGIDGFWLCGSIRISAMEQVDYLKKLYTGDLPGFSKRTQELVKDLMLFETTPTYKLYGKTGGGDCWDDKTIGWYVGFLETTNGSYVFAMNMFAKTFEEVAARRIQLTKDIFRSLNIITE